MSNNNVDEKIDFVVLWVDGDDENWQKEKQEYLDLRGDSSKTRFRDCDNLQYLFRGIDKYAPWVNKIFFITWGHLPKWLDTSNEKIRVVNHKEFIPAEYLPTFNSNVIELNLHRIKDLSEKFVLFNDDLFLLKPTKKTDFFKNGKPRDVYAEYTQLASAYNDRHFFMKANILAIINKYFDKRTVVRKNIFKMLNLKYKKLNFKTLQSLGYKKKFCGFWNFHAPQPYLKETFRRIWDLEQENLDHACHNKFRDSTDLGHYLCRYWQMVEGNFIPKKDESKYLTYLDDNTETIKALRSGKYKMVCINDVYIHIDFEKAKSEINAVLDEFLPDKCQFEL